MRLHGQGLRAWILQRLSALYLAGFTLYLLFAFVFDTPAGYEEWRAWIAAPIFSLAVALFFAALLLHALVGLRDVVMDYVHPPVLRFTLHTMIGVLTFVLGIWALRVLFQAAAI